VVLPAFHRPVNSVIWRGAIRLRHSQRGSAYQRFEASCGKKGDVIDLVAAAYPFGYPGTIEIRLASEPTGACHGRACE
jgi:hypothetical protein